MTKENKEDKTGVINDPLGLPSVPAKRDFHLIMKFSDGPTDRRTYVLRTEGRTDGHV